MKEKLLAAHRQGIFEVILPKDNEKDLPDIPENIRKEMKLHFVTSMDEVLKLALEREIVALPWRRRLRPWSWCEKREKSGFLSSAEAADRSAAPVAGPAHLRPVRLQAA